ncbi:hypothetical protein H5410_014196 [Solanum commersonii]|uniref:Uncharacterized protein n=1 Tax=Solanum commersonii TaxID=4109 RepID=A0A9J5ZQN4_SOLCO|nr:hypothetical protein H5410_014196 [Solanum commersonii]
MNSYFSLCPDVGMAKIILKCIGTHYNGVYPNWSSIPLNTQGQMFNEFKEKELGRPVAVPEMFKVTHVKKSKNPTEEEKWIEPRAQETYIDIYLISQNIVVLYLLRVKTDHLHKKKTRIFGNRVLVNRLEVQSTAIQKRRIRRKSLGIVVHHPQALMVGIERQYLQWRVR